MFSSQQLWLIWQTAVLRITLGEQRNRCLVRKEFVTQAKRLIGIAFPMHDICSAK